MLVRQLLALIALSTTACIATAGCAAGDESADDDDIHIGDGMAAGDEMVAERQLNGSELPANTLSLTFDDGPGDRTAELVDFLDAHDIKATFFINGMRAPGRQRHIDAVVSHGHILANHTQDHKQLTSLSAAGIVSQVAQTDAIIARAQPNGPWLIRAPFGAWNGNVARALNDTPMSKYVGSIFWDEGGVLTSTAAADWDCWGHHMAIEACGNLYLNEIRSKHRGVVLMHDIQNKTVDMVKFIVPKLIAEGFKFVQLTDVPSVKRGIAAAGGTNGTGPTQCASATLGHPVNENVCVQSRSNQNWFRCVAGDWAPSTGPSDAACTERFAL